MSTSIGTAVIIAGILLLIGIVWSQWGACRDARELQRQIDESAAVCRLGLRYKPPLGGGS